MLLRAFLCVSLTATALLASPLGASASGSLAPLDLPTVQAAFEKVSAAVDKMTEAVNAYDGDELKLPAILESSVAISKMNTEGAEVVKKSKTMGIMDALTLVGLTQALQEKVVKVVAALNTKKDMLEKAGAKAEVLDQMMVQRKAADVLTAAVLGNLPLPSLIGPIASAVAATITDALNAGITAWGGTPPPVPTSTPATSSTPKASTPKASTPKGGKGGKGGTAPPVYRRNIENRI